ncbi:MAG: hypothetical protein ABSC76_01995 [Terracidiphilus sp.]
MNSCYTTGPIVESITDIVAILSVRNDGEFSGFKSVARGYFATELIDES